VHVSSLSARILGPGLGVYGASKAALEAMAEALYFEVAEFGVRVRVIEAGQYQSKSLANSPNRSIEVPPHYAALAERMAATRFDGTPRDPDEVAQAIVAAVYDMGPQFRYVVGEHTEALIAERDSMTWEEWTIRMREFPGRR
jgi:NAD(P)-dependent dehydrogenase (short-subunit alcohol dehydrogenase family)